MNKLFIVVIAMLITSCTTIPAPTVRPFADSHDWVLMEDITYQIGESGHTITVPKGFVTDFASIPKTLWSFGLSQHGPYSKAAIIHDYLYWSQGCTKEQADNILAIAMKESGVSEKTATIIYIGVRLGGKSSWLSNRAERDKQFPKIIPIGYLELPDNVTWTEYRQELIKEGVKDPEFEIHPAYCELGNSREIPGHG
ncbi:DUF1353 domain-containing protein [Dickeya undicola]|uniref:DUF1353 domain-containing protein n=1 Tax=Dickeya undicola TaxID=1577887 RepID=A0A3N0G401_9GAMM|nr:DUF1353 domain-containing protein [Dickeya undicola]RNM06860.1 DUF1353 domain-containing protein [Dickeya undicola]